VTLASTHRIFVSGSFCFIFWPDVVPVDLIYSSRPADLFHSANLIYSVRPKT